MFLLSEALKLWNSSSPWSLCRALPPLRNRCVRKAFLSQPIYILQNGAEIMYAFQVPNLCPLKVRSLGLTERLTALPQQEGFSLISLGTEP